MPQECLAPSLTNGTQPNLKERHQDFIGGKFLRMGQQSSKYSLGWSVRKLTINLLSRLFTQNVLGNSKLITSVSEATSRQPGRHLTPSGDLKQDRNG